MESGQGTPRDTDMASPPSSFRSTVSNIATTTAASTSTSTSQPDPVPADSTSQNQRSSKQKQRVPDGYIYQAYYDPSRSRRHLQEQQEEANPSSIGGTSRNNQASATRILELRGLERRIVQLLETAGEAIQILSGEDDEDEDNKGNQTMDQATLVQMKDQKVAKFNALASSYMTLVNEIQGGMRRQFHYLTKAGITSSQVPFKNVVYGEEKELETWLNAVDVLKESTRHLVDNIGSELQENDKMNHSTSRE